MAAPTDIQYQVFGAAQVWLGLGSGTGAARLLQYLGITEEGVRPIHDRKLGEIRTDAAGPEVPAELQHFGEIAQIDVDLAVWSKTTLDKAAAGIVGGTPGVMPTMGTLIGTNAHSYHLAIVPPSGSVMVAREYNNAILRGAQEIKLSSKYSVMRCRFFAWTFIPAREVTGFDAPFGDSANAAVYGSAGAKLYVDGAIATERFDA